MTSGCILRLPGNATSVRMQMPCRVGFSVPGLDPGGPGSGSRKIPLLSISSFLFIVIIVISILLNADKY